MIVTLKSSFAKGGSTNLCVESKEVQWWHSEDKYEITVGETTYCISDALIYLLAKMDNTPHHEQYYHAAYIMNDSGKTIHSLSTGNQRSDMTKMLAHVIRAEPEVMARKLRETATPDMVVLLSSEFNHSQIDCNDWWETCLDQAVKLANSKLKGNL